MWKFPPSTLFLIVLLPPKIAKCWLFHIREKADITGYLGNSCWERLLLSSLWGGERDKRRALLTMGLLHVAFSVAWI